MTEGLRIYNLFPTLAGSIAEWTARAAADRGDEVQRGLRQPVSRYRLFRQPLRGQGYYRLNPRFRGEARETGDDDLLRGFTKAAEGHGLRVGRGPCRQSYGEGQRADLRAGRYGSPATRGARQMPVAVRRRSGRSRKRRPFGAISPNSTTARRSATRSSRISRIWCAIM